MKVEELFIPIEGFEDYAVSNYGRVIDIREDRELQADRGDSAGRLRVRFPIHEPYVIGISYLWLDDLIAEAFFVDYKPGVTIFYKNGNRDDCTVLNLTFVEPKEG